MKHEFKKCPSNMYRSCIRRCGKDTLQEDSICPPCKEKENAAIDRGPNFKKFTDADTNVWHKNGGILKIRNVIKIEQENCFIPDSKTDAVVSEIASAIYEIVKKHGVNW